MLVDELLDLLMQIASDDAELGNTVLAQRIHRALQQGALTDFQQALGGKICQRAQP